MESKIKDGSQTNSPEIQESSPSSTTDTDDYHIFIGDLAPNIEEDFLLATFETFGRVTECKIIKDMHTQKPKGYGFVAYKSKQEAELAIQAMNGQLLGHRIIRTNWAVRRNPEEQAKDHRPLSYVEVFNASSLSNTTIYVGGITTGLNEHLLRESFQEFGTIKEMRIFKEKGFSFIRFDTHAAAAKAIVTMHGQPVGDVSCKCSWGKEPIFSNRGYFNVTNSFGPVSTSTWPTNSMNIFGTIHSGNNFAAAAAAANQLIPLFPDNSDSRCNYRLPTKTSQMEPLLTCMGYQQSTKNAYPVVIGHPTKAVPSFNRYDCSLANKSAEIFQSVNVLRTEGNPTTHASSIVEIPHVSPSECIPQTFPFFSSLIPLPATLTQSKLSADHEYTTCNFQAPFCNRMFMPNKFDVPQPEDHSVNPSINLAIYPQYSLPLRTSNFMPIVPWSLTNINIPSAYKCGLLNSEAIQRNQFISNFDGISPIC